MRLKESFSETFFKSLYHVTIGSNLMMKGKTYLNTQFQINREVIYINMINRTYLYNDCGVLIERKYKEFRMESHSIGNKMLGGRDKAN